MSYKKVKLSEICTIEKGATGITKAIEGEYPMVTMAAARTSHNEYQFDTKAVLIPLVSSSGHGHASMKRIHYQEGKFAVGSILCALVPKNEDIVNARFLYNYLHFQRESILVPLMRGAANVSLSIKSISSVEINLPPIETQISINKLVDDFKLRQDIFQTELKTQSNLLSKLRQAYLQEAVMGKLSEPRLSGLKDDRILDENNLENIADDKILKSSNPSGATFRNPSSDKNTQETGKSLLKAIKSQKAELIKQGKLRKEKPLAPIKPEEIPFEIPDNWVWCRLGDLALYTDYGTSQKADLDSNNIPVLRMGNIQEGSLSFDSLKYVESNIDDLPKLYLKNGDFLFNRTNSFELVGKSAIFKEKDDTFTFASYLIRVRFSDTTLTQYLTFWINSKNCRKTQIEPNTIQQNGQANFNGTKLKDILIPLPPLSEQKAIVAKVEGLLGNISLLESENKAQQMDVQRLMGAVLQEAFGGR